MITMLLAAMAFAPPAPIHCPVMGGTAKDSQPFVLYKGVVYGFCCGGCVGGFESTPDKFIKAYQGEGLLGFSAYDVVEMTVVDPKKAVAYSDYNRVRYYFLSKENKSKFDANAKKFAAVPENESFEAEGALVHSKLTGYRDYNGTRYYFCCEGCLPNFQKDAAAFAKEHGSAKAKVYRIELK